MIDNQFRITIRNLTYILHPRQLVLVINEDGFELWDGFWSECNCIGDYEVLDIGPVISEEYEHYIFIQIKKEVISDVN